MCSVAVEGSRPACRWAVIPPWWEHQRSNRQRIPKGVFMVAEDRRAGGLVVFTNDTGQVLLVLPREEERQYWQLPGGHAGRNESPRLAAMREVKEELGLTIKLGGHHLLLMEYVSGRPDLPENYLSVWNGGLLTRKPEIILSPDELKMWMWADPRDLRKYTLDYQRVRIEASLEVLINRRAPRYLEDGELV